MAPVVASIIIKGWVKGLQKLGFRVCADMDPVQGGYSTSTCVLEYGNLEPETPGLNRSSGMADQRGEEISGGAGPPNERRVCFLDSKFKLYPVEVRSGISD